MTALPSDLFRDWEIAQAEASAAERAVQQAVAGHLLGSGPGPSTGMIASAMEKRAAATKLFAEIAVRMRKAATGNGDAGGDESS